MDSGLAKWLPEKLCRDHLIAPVAFHDAQLEVAFFTPRVLHIADELQLITGLTVSTWPGNETRDESTSFEEVEASDEEREDDAAGGEEVLHLDQPPPPGRDGSIIRYVNHVFQRAFQAGASDIHVESSEDHCRVRLRIDGSLTEITPPPQSLFVPIVSRIKVLAKMDIAEKRLPQDGAIALKSGDKRIDVRVSTVPTVFGEKVVLRVLDKSAISLQLSALGLDERQSKDLVESIRMPHGLMLVTGPTGSGKSTTLYACLHLLNKPGGNICTVEDPVEYKLEGINQIQVKAHVGLTFAGALRSFLRQDPDIIMVMGITIAGLMMAIYIPMFAMAGNVN